jgi:hypothetical protein
MWSIAVAFALTCCGQEIDSNTPAPADAMIAELHQGLQTGSLVFSRGDCLAVKIFSQSAYTHVGGVVMKDGEAIVYDSMNGVGVRKTPFAEYLRQQTPSTIHIVHPRTPFTAEKTAAYVLHLETQLGRKYAVKHHLTGKRCEGLHCSEYMTDALMAAEIMSAVNPPRVSPGSLLEGVISTNKYVDGIRVELKLEEPHETEPVASTWYQRAWRSTSVCCSKSTTQMRRWVLCR